MYREPNIGRDGAYDQCLQCGCVRFVDTILSQDAAINEVHNYKKGGSHRIFKKDLREMLGRTSPVAGGTKKADYPPNRYSFRTDSALRK